MKYLILIYSNMENWSHPSFLATPEAEAMDQGGRDEMSAQFDSLLREISESGELVAGVPLAAPDSANTIRAPDGVPAATDGPYSEAKEQLAGYFVVDCDSRARAVEIASRFPDVRSGAVEVRPIMADAGEEM